LPQGDGSRFIGRASLEAVKLRFLPIPMTAFAFILGVLLLVRATVAGANGRKV
jgi:multidrug efflux pump subunit AcrB